MRVVIETDSSLKEDEVVIRCREIDESVIKLQQMITGADLRFQRLEVYKGDESYYVLPKDILFMETNGSKVMVQTRTDIYTTSLKLYELEKVLPVSFCRVSKSAIVNRQNICSIKKNIAGASRISFARSEKITYASRSYLKELLERMSGAAPK